MKVLNAGDNFIRESTESCITFADFMIYLANSILYSPNERI